MGGCSKTEGCEIGRKEAQREAFRLGRRVNDWLIDGSGRLSSGSMFEILKRKQREPPSTEIE